MRSTTIAGVGLVSIVLAACGGNGRPTKAPESDLSTVAPAAPGAPSDVLAWVNGAPITELDVRSTMQPGTELTVPMRKNLLDVLIDKELKAQQARKLGLDQQATYQDRIRPLQARVDAAARTELDDLWYRNQVVDAAQVDEAAEQAYFQTHQDQIRTEWHFEQILLRKRQAIDAARAALQAGASFDEVAAAQMPTPQVAKSRPWDLGWLQWGQVPEAWTPVVDKLQPGQTSDVIEGPGSRFWLVRLVEERRNEQATFEEYKPFIHTVLQRQEIGTRQADLEQQLRSQAQIRYVDPPPPLSPPPADEE